MKIENSYIFLRNKKTKANKSNTERNTIVLDIPTSIHTYIIKIFNITDTAKNDLSFKRIYNCIMHVNNIDFIANFTINYVAENTYLDVLVEGKTKSQIIKCLEYIHNAIENSEIKEEYIIIVSYDSISEYYCNKIYPKLNNLERNLRKLLFNIYVVNFGKEYFRDIDNNLQNKSKGIIKAKGNSKKKEIEYIQKFFYSLEYTDIQKLLFETRYTKADKEKNTKFLAHNPDLSKLSDKELREAFINLKAKSDWERFFDKKIPNMDVQGVLDNIRQHRNNIAHCKFFYYNQYIECRDYLNKLTHAINSAIKITEESDFSKKNIEQIKNALSSFSDFLEHFKLQISYKIDKQYFNSASHSIQDYFSKFEDSLTSHLFPHNEADSREIDTTEEDTD